jgi:hypothetical protein
MRESYRDGRQALSAADERVATLLYSFRKSLLHDRRAIDPPCPQLKLAQDASLRSVKAVASLERGRSRDANLSTLVRLASALNGDVIEMLTRYRTEPAGSR